MRNIIFYLTIFLLFNNLEYAKTDNYDLTIISYLSAKDGFFKIPVNIIDTLSSKLKINFINSLQLPIDFEEIPLSVRHIAQKNKGIGNVSLYIDNLWTVNGSAVNLIPKSPIKIAITLIEAENEIPEKWVELLNSIFDAVVIVDDFCLPTFNKKIKIPIFVIPLILNLQDFFNEPLKKSHGKPFTFGIASAFYTGKNQMLALEAFAQEFGNDPNLKLHITGRGGDSKTIKDLQNKVKELKLKNVIIESKVRTCKEYINLMSSFDCYVLLSLWEGFSISPRESLALGIPTIISNNTAHKTICKSGYVIPIETTKAGKLFVPLFNSAYSDYNISKIEDVKKAMRYVYSNYTSSLEQAKKGRGWVRQYLPENLQPFYLNLIKPKKLILGKKNEVTRDYLMTKSKKLYDKYNSLLNKKLQ